ncbi:type II secretion system F family protein [Psychrobacillus lasiicapitis]|uniref:Type II secretion system F family protein n=1 Tax=Psychrobacillus lasiicapitis TaxID=1636719 RepID=A0A544T8M7_9BACI|nr:type II secretion system F family protein [Psychrobacillus lasiicapitis]TQR13812.1 type II secretion system F family protein [Psychrobacillus lasiicapitis]GGA35612.1 phytochrome sensor protein [Psychrobacillus lasiicapitis]
MVVYKYVGRTSRGTVKKGIVDATNKQTAITRLRSQGINPREIEESKSILHKELALGGKVKNQDFVIYSRQFATLIRAGVSILESTKILAEQTSSKPLKKGLQDVEEDVRSGLSFSDAAAKNPKVFPALFVNMIRAGEATGNLDESLERLAFSYEKQFKLKKKVQSTLAYPVVLLFLTIVVSVFLMLTIVPQFVSMFEDMGAELPMITKIVMGISESLQSSWYIYTILFLIIVIVFNYLYKKNEQFNYSVHLLLLRLPVFGKLLQKSAIARMTRTLSSLFSSSVPILQALTIVEKVIGNPVVGKVVKDSRTSLEKGSTLSAPLAKSWIFPPLVTQMTSIGESTGSLDYMLEKIADFYEDDVDRTVDTLKSLIEPLMIVFLAAIIGTIVMAIMIPMFSMYEQI